MQLTDPTHYIIQFRDVAVGNGDTIFIVHILSILSEEGKVLVSTMSTPKCFIRGQVYKDREYTGSQYGFLTGVFVCKCMSVRRIICEVILEKNEDGPVVSKDSQMDLYDWSEKLMHLMMTILHPVKKMAMNFMKLIKLLMFIYTESTTQKSTRYNVRGMVLKTTCA